MLNLPEGASLEGYFYPATYSLEPKIDLKSAVNVILAEFLKETQEPWFARGDCPTRLELT